MTTRTTAAALLSLVLLSGVASAGDSTTVPHPNMSWQHPDARSLGGVSSCPIAQVLTWNGSVWACTDTIANAGNATTSQYADNSGELGGNSMPSCPAGYALSGVNGRWLCVNTVANSGYATNSGTANTASYASTAGYANSTGSPSIPGCPSVYYYHYGSSSGTLPASPNGGYQSLDDGTPYSITYTYLCVAGTWVQFSVSQNSPSGG